MVWVTSLYCPPKAAINHRRLPSIRYRRIRFRRYDSSFPESSSTAHLKKETSTLFVTPESAVSQSGHFVVLVPVRFRPLATASSASSGAG